MFNRLSGPLSRAMLAGASAIAIAAAAPAWAEEQTRAFDIPAQPLSSALMAYSRQSDTPVAGPMELLDGKRAPSVQGSMTREQALLALLDGSGLKAVSGTTGGIIIQRVDSGPQAGSAGGGAETNVVQELVVTAQKKSENIQVVPIAISAFTQQDLTTRQVAGGPDLMTQVPNMTFTKTNFSGYSIQIRGIGTQAISATTDAAVAVAFNNTPFIRNRFFEQEFYDLERVEVLRGPQGTLYGRNATAGVVNILSAKPSFQHEEKLSADVGNYGSKRLEGMINMPLVDDKVALRVAGAWTKRDGYDTNQITGNPIDGRDLWSTRVSLRIEPTDRVRANLIWEHFQEDDDRLRSGKQLCHTDVPQTLDGYDISNNPGLPNIGQGSSGWNGAQGVFSQGCAPASLYSPDSFQTPNGFSLPYYLPLGAVFLPTALLDPYVSRKQSSDLRTIESTVDPIYRAKSDLAEVQLSFDLTEHITLASETAYDADNLFSLEDYNRFNTAPGAWAMTASRPGVLTPGPNGGIFCDPQLGCSDRLIAVDASTAKSRQFSQEFRLSSAFDGPLNFSVGANFLRYDTEDKYYVFINSISIISAISPYGYGMAPPYVGGVTDNAGCMRGGLHPPDPTKPQPILNCTYLDPNPIGSLNDEGHNYFLSRNPYKLISYAAFGEVYYNITDTLKLTGGLRWTVDKKQAPLIPSWLLASDSVGYPVAQVINQSWSEPTGRLALDWRPVLPFTDQTLLYASFGRGYKAGGANPPPYGVAIFLGNEAAQDIISQSATHPRTFNPEFVNAFEVGTKNTLLDGKLTVNADAFYYDYKGYQISQIVDRSAVNMNFDAKVWGLELETDWRPIKNLRLGFKGGYENTRVADGMKAIDIMDRTAGHTDWVVVKPFPSIPSNCILPKWLFLGADYWTGTPELVNLGGAAGGNPGGCELAYVFNHDPVTNLPYVPNPTVGASGGDFGIFHGVHSPYPGWDPSTAPNHGEGFYKDLSGNELPNAPHYTATITADYMVPLPHEWLLTLHTDLYYQSEAWTRIFNMPGYDRLKAYSNINVAAIFSNEDAGWRAMLYVKNVLNRDSITGAFLNSDDTGLTTNVFLTEPRLYGIRITKDWSGNPVWGVLGLGGGSHKAGDPYPLTLEVGGQIQRDTRSHQPITPSFIDAFGPAIDPTRAQDHELDWGDGREVKLTYAVAGSPWRAFLEARRGKADGAGKFSATQDGDSGCLFGADCADYAMLHSTDWANATVTDHEEHLMLDFMIGRDFGLGMPGWKSNVQAGLRYAEFKSRTGMTMQGMPDWSVPDSGAFFTNPSTHHLYQADLEADRRFKGVGPILAWEASARLFGEEDAGHADVDLAIQGGVLFGKQKSFVKGQESSAYFSGLKYYSYDLTRQVGDTVITRGPAPRAKSASVPTVGASIGVSYELQRLKLSTGYRWERYFNVLDAGYAERKDVDRSFDGPYFRISIGLGN